MLKNQDSPQTTPQNAAQVRVTPEELAAAISRIEARKDADQHQVEGTVAIGEIVQQLGLEATPEEVLAEVQACRRLAPKKRQASFGQRLVLLLGLSGVVLGLAVDGASLLSRGDHRNGNNVQPILPAPSLVVGDASGRLVMLSEVGDNQPVHSILVNEGSDFEFYPYMPGASPDKTWSLVKHSGQVYVRGWIVKMSKEVLEANGADVTATPSEARNIVVPITLPLSSFKIVPSSGDSEEFHAVDVHLDRHAWEKW